MATFEIKIDVLKWKEIDKSIRKLYKQGVCFTGYLHNGKLRGCSPNKKDLEKVKKALFLKQP